MAIRWALGMDGGAVAVGACKGKADAKFLWSSFRNGDGCQWGATMQNLERCIEFWCPLPLAAVDDACTGDKLLLIHPVHASCLLQVRERMHEVQNLVEGLPSGLKWHDMVRDMLSGNASRVGIEHLLK